MVSDSIADINFKGTSQFFDSTSALYQKIISLIEDLLRRKGEDSATRSLRKWMNAKKGVYFHEISHGHLAELKYHLRDNNIGFIQVHSKNGGTGLIVKDIDVKKVEILERDILILQGNYYQCVNASEMEESLSRCKQITDKDVLSIHGIDKYELEVLKNKSNSISKGFMVGISDESNDKFGISVHGKNLITYKTGKNGSYKDDFCFATLKMCISLYGPNKEQKKTEIDADEALDKKVFTKITKKTRYIVSEDNKEQYIELSPSGFDYYYRGECVKKVPAGSTNYDVELQIAMDKMQSKSIIGEQEFYNYMSNDIEIKSNRPKRNESQIKQSFGEDKLVQQINNMVKEKMSNKYDEHEEDLCYRTYRKECAEIITALINHEETINGYSTEKVDNLYKIIEEHDLNMSAYKESVKKIDSINHEVHKANSKEHYNERNHDKQREEIS